MHLLAAFVLASTVTLVAGSPGLTQPPALVPTWTLEGFDAPESVLVLDDGRLVVSNVTGEADARDGTGYLSLVSAEGEVLQQRWLTGLDAPKGLAVQGGVLHVADIDRVARFDLASEERLEDVAVSGAGFLNDAAVLGEAGVLVSDSATGRVYLISGGEAEIWFESEAVAGLNGLFVEPGRILVAAMDGHLYAIDRETRTHEVLVSELGNGDGIAALPGGGYVLSAWPGELFYWDGAGELVPLADTREAPVYQNDLTVVDRRVYVPNWLPGTLTAWRTER